MNAIETIEAGIETAGARHARIWSIGSTNPPSASQRLELIDNPIAPNASPRCDHTVYRDAEGILRKPLQRELDWT